jgi:hypothetical protein
MRRIIYLLLLLIAPRAWADDTNWCKTPITVQSDPSQQMLFRLRCGIQKLDQERSDAENRSTQNEIQADLANAKLDDALKQLGELRAEVEKMKSRVATMDEAEKRLHSVCSWRGVKNEPTAKFCRWWETQLH